MPIHVEPRGPEHTEASEARMAEFQQMIKSRLQTSECRVRVGKAQKVLNGNEQVGIYVTPYTTGVETYLNDVACQSAPVFTQEKFLTIVYQCLNTTGYEVDRKRN